MISYAEGVKQSLEKAVSANDEKDSMLNARDARIVDLVDKVDKAEARVDAQDQVINQLHEHLERDKPKTRSWLDTLKKIEALVCAIEMSEDGAEALDCVEPQSLKEPVISASTQSDNSKTTEPQTFANAGTQTDASLNTLEKPVSIISSLPVEAQSALQTMHRRRNGVDIPDAPYSSVLIDNIHMPVCHPRKNSYMMHVLTPFLTSSGSASFERATKVVEKQ